MESALRSNMSIDPAASRQSSLRKGLSQVLLFEENGKA